MILDLKVHFSPKFSTLYNALMITLPIPLYHRTLVIFIGSSSSEIFEWGRVREFKWDDQFESDIRIAVKEDLGFVQTFGEQSNRHILMWLKENKENILVHELVHVMDTVAHTVDERCLLFDEDGQSEARAYLFEYLFVETQKLLTKS